MKKYLNPYTDFGFKKIFGEEANKHLLIDFLNAVLNVEHKIIDITFKNREKFGISRFDRYVILDIYCTDDKGSHFIVEMQKAKHENYKDRVLYYSSYLIRDQGKKGKWNYWLAPTHCISIVDFKLENRYKDRVVHTVKLKDTDGDVFYDKLTYYFIEMPNFKKRINEIESRLDKWLFFLKNLESFSKIPIIFGDKIFQSAFEVAEISKLDTEEMKKYEFSLKKFKSIEGVRNAYMKDGEMIGIEKGIKIGKEEGRKEGKEEGRKEGKEEGIEVGRNEGIKEGLKEGKEKGRLEVKLELAERFLKSGFSVEEVVKLTQLSNEVVLEIENKQKED